MIDDLLHIISWLEAQCPLESLYKLSKDSHAQALVTKHAFMHAFMTTTFMLWSLDKVPVASCLVHGEMLSSTTKQLLERKVVSSDKEESAKQHSPDTKAAPAPPNQLLAPST
jgi:hypothetical protein